MSNIGEASAVTCERGVSPSRSSMVAHRLATS
jgi:hypothetical protein